MASRVGSQLAQDGYRGPFGIDGFVYRGSDGQTRVHPLCEINARLSFGFVARALARHREAGAVTLRLGSGPIPRSPPAQDRSARIIPLLDPAPDDPTSAWLVATSPDGQRVP